MPSSRAWIFQATPQGRPLAGELVATDTLLWSVARYGRDLRPGDRVYYWQAGRDAGIYGVGYVDEITPPGPDRRYTVRTRHAHALFAPITRDDLRVDPVLQAIGLLRQPRGTVFPLTPAQDGALAQRAGMAGLVLAVPAARRRGRTLLLQRDDGEAPARVEAAYARGDDIIVALIGEAGPAGETAIEHLHVGGVRRRRGGDMLLSVEPLPGDVVLPDPPVSVVQAARDRAVVIPAEAFPEPSEGPLEDERPWRVAEERGDYAAPGIFAPPAGELFGDLLLPPELAAQVGAAVTTGRHIVFMGIPGTGKTTLALRLAAVAAAAGYTAGPLLATATADWTTFDTVGGLLPGSDGALHFGEGVALRAIRENRWLVLDELNRADIDKAFGPLLTVLSGGPVELPAVGAVSRPIRIEPVTGPTGVLDDGVTYRVGPGWRIIATMNTLDRAALFSLSLAFTRRFAFILVPPPETEPFLSLLRQRVQLDAPAMALLRQVLRVTPRPLGPAILLDAARYIAARADSAAMGEAVGVFVLPQLEGLDHVALRKLVVDLTPFLGAAGDATVRAYADALYGEG